MIVKERLLLLTILCCFFALVLKQASFAQNPKGTSNFDILKLEVEGNFLNSHVNYIYQDSKGFMWFGTENGICRYDGTDIVEFTTTNSKLPFNSVYRIFEDDQGVLWLTNKYHENEIIGNVAFLNLNTLKIRIPDKKDSIQFPEGLRIIEGKEHVLYFVGENIELLYQYKNGQLEEIKNKNISNNLTIAERRYKRICQANELGIYNLTFYTSDKARYRFIGLDENGNKLLVSTGREGFGYISNISEIKSNGEIIAYDLVKMPLEFRNSKIFYNQSTKDYWVVNNHQLIIANADNEAFYDFKEAYPKLLYGEIYNIGFFDDIIWLCASNGVFKIKRKNSFFDQHLAKSIDSKGLNSCRSIYTENNEDIIIATVNNLQYILDGKKKILAKINHSPVIDKKGDTLYLGNHEINQLLDYKRIEKITTRILDHQSIWTSYKDQSSDDLYWLGLGKGLASWKEGMDSIEIFNHYNGFEKLKESEVYDLKPLGNGHILIATNSGIYELSTEKGILHRYWKGGGKGYYLPLSEFYYIYIDEEGMVWLASNGGGLVKWDKDSGEYQQFDAESGFSSSIICAIYEDDFNNLWLPSYYGLMKFNKETSEVKTYTIDDGLSHNEFNRGSHFRAFDGKLYFGGLNGVNSFYPKNLEEKSIEKNAPLYLLNVHHFNKEENVLINKLIDFKRDSIIRLLPQEGFINIEFSLLDYKNEKTKSYTYQIEGRDNIRTFHTRDNTVRINGLNYGDYTIRIKGRMTDGHYSSQELVLPLRVEKPWYLEWIIPIIILIIISLITIVYSIFKWRNKWLVERAKELGTQVKKQTFQLEKDKSIIEKQAQELLELDRVKSRFFANVSHELRTPITLIQGPIHSLLKRNNLDAESHGILKKVKHNTQDLMELVNELLDLTKVEAGNLNLDESDVLFYSLVNRKFSSFQSIAEMKEIQFSLDYQMDRELGLKVDKSKLEKVLNNLLSNAFKFTPKGGTIQMLVEDLRSDIKIQIKDSGRGIPEEDIPYVFDRFYQSSKNQKAEGGLGIGLALSAEFIKLFGGKLWVESRMGKGSTFFMQFPKKKVTIANELNEENHLEKEELSRGIHLTNAPFVKPSKELILLVEDHLGLQEYIHSILKSHYEIRIVSNGKEALDWLGEGRKPSLIISDLMMPVMDGFEFLDIIKKSTLLSHIPCIMLTARADMKDKLKALRIGVDDYVTKPFNEDELKARIINLLMNYDARRSFVNENERAKAINDVPMVSEKDQKWLKNLEQTILEKISHHSFSVDFLAEAMFTNRDKLFKKTKRIIGMTPNQYVRIVRLQLAKRLLENGDCIRVKDVSIQVGFQKVDYFSKLYKEQFGKSPSEYIR